MTPSSPRCQFGRTLRAVVIVLASSITVVCMPAPTRADEPAAAPKPRPVIAVAFSPDGKLLAAGAGGREEPGALVVWELATRKPRFVHEDVTGIPSVVFAPDGKTLAIGRYGPQAELFDVATGEKRRTFEGHTGAVRSVAFSRQGDILVTGSWDHTVKFWDPAGETCLKTFVGHTSDVMSAALSPDGATLVSCGHDNTTRIWDPKTGKLKQTLNPTPLVVRHIAFSPDGRFFVTSHYDGVVRIRETDSARLRAHIRTEGGAECARFSPDGRTLAVCTLSPLVQLFDIDLNEPAPELERKIAGLIVRWDDDDYAVREAASSELVKIGMPASGQLTKAMESESAEMRMRARRARSAAWSPPPRVKLTGYAAEATCVAFSPDGKWMASGDRSGIVIIRDAATHAEIATLVVDGKKPK